MKTRAPRETDLEEAKREFERLLDYELDLLADCQKCKQCIRVCPTYEGWYTQSPVGRLMAIQYHFRHGLGDEKELAELLFSCLSCRRCQTQCRMTATGVKSADIIVRARELLVRRARARQEAGNG